MINNRERGYGGYSIPAVLSGGNPEVEG